jgi:hypothetical protein
MAIRVFPPWKRREAIETSWITSGCRPCGAGGELTLSRVRGLSPPATCLGPSGAARPCRSIPFGIAFIVLSRPSMQNKSRIKRTSLSQLVLCRPGQIDDGSMGWIRCTRLDHWINRIESQAALAACRWGKLGYDDEDCNHCHRGRRAGGDRIGFGRAVFDARPECSRRQ